MNEPRYTVQMRTGLTYDVIDRVRSNSIDGDFKLCECEDAMSAEEIAAAMNLVEWMRRSGR